MKKRNTSNSSKLAFSYIPEIRSFGGRSPFAKTLLTLGDEFLRENREKIDRLPEKHKAEFFALLSEAFPCRGGYYPPANEENFREISAKPQKMLLTNPQKQNFTEVFDGFDFSACFEMEKNNFFLYFNCPNIFYGVSKQGFFFSAEDFDASVFANPEIARWFIKNGGNSFALNVEIASPSKIILKTESDLLFNENDLEIGIEILNDDFLPKCNFTKPLFSFGTQNYLKPDLILRSGEMQEPPFYPFGCPLEHRCDFFIANSEAFSKHGAKVILWINLQFEEFHQEYEGLEEKNNKADKVSFQYFNGERFVLLPESKNNAKFFNGERQGVRDFLFTVPDDIEICEISGVISYWIRVCLEEARDLYYRPCRMLCPKIDDIQITYGASFEPQNNTKYENIYGENPCFYMGFDEIPEDKLTLFINGQNYAIPAVSDKWEISTQNGFIPLRVIDETESFAYSGRIVFDIPKSAKPCEVDFFNENLYWLRTPIIEDLAQYPFIKIIDGRIISAPTDNTGDDNTDNVGADIIRPQTQISELKLKLTNAAQMITAGDVSNMLLTRFPLLKEVKCSYDKTQDLLSLYIKIEEKYFNGYAPLIREYMSKNSDYTVKILRPKKAFVKIRAVILESKESFAKIREKLCEFLDGDWRIGHFPDESIIRGFFEDNGIKADKVVVSAVVYTSDLKDNRKEFMISDIKGGFYACSAGEIILCSE